MGIAEIPQGAGPPLQFVVNITTQPGELDLTTVIGANMAVRKPDGTVVAWSATFTPAPTIAVIGATPGTPVTLQLASTVALEDSPSVTVANVGGLTGVTGDFFAFIPEPGTIQLFEDALFTIPVTASGTYTSGGGVTPNTTGTVTHSFASPTSASPNGDIDQVGTYSVAPSLTVPGGSYPCKAVPLLGLSPFAAQGPYA
jgi:hypothetical protein